VLAAFQEMAQGRGQVEPNEDVLGDGVAFAGVARYPARVKCALLGWMAFKDAVGRSASGSDNASDDTAGASVGTVEPKEAAS
jgi:nitrogen fixation NifU-like protein